jgi:hypothetical protein
VDAEAARTAMGQGKNAARNLHRLISKYNLAEQVRISEINAAGQSIPILDVRDMLEHMVSCGQLYRLMGNDASFNDLNKAGDTLEEFWKCYLRIHPDYWLASEFEAGRLNPRRVIPVYTHLDEGRG